MKVTFVGMATVILEIGGTRIITDPVLDPPGTDYTLGSTGVVRYTNLVGPALQDVDLDTIDYALVSHDHHKDNLDREGRDLLKSISQTITTVPGGKRLRDRHGVKTVGLRPWQNHQVTLRDGSTLKITATPARHGPPIIAQVLAGDVIGFLLEWQGFRNGAVYLTGDTRLFSGVRKVAKDFDVGTVMMNLGAGQFNVTKSVCYSMPASEGAQVAGLFPSASIIPLHYDGWSHLGEDKDDVTRAFSAPALASRLKWLPRGETIDLDT